MHYFELEASDSDFTSAFVEAWIAHLANEAGVGIDSESWAMPPHTPSPSKRKKPHPDPDTTPTAIGLPNLSHVTLDLDSVSLSASDDASVSSSSAASRRSTSPKKRETELRQATEYPLHRNHISNLSEPTPLMVDLYSLQDGPVVPMTVKDLLTKSSTWSTRPRATWFYDVAAPPNDSPQHLDADMYCYSRLSIIRENTLLCKTRMDHEAGWNDSVHYPLLEVALRGEPSISYRNVTACRIRTEFRDKSPFLVDVKIDYALLLDPPSESSLAASIRAYRSPDPRNRCGAHIMLPDHPNTPAAIPIETKSANADMLLGPVQLATWARAHFRYMERLPAAGQMPILPVIFVHGARWRVDFAQRTEDRLTMWEGFEMGSSDEMYGCYSIVAHLRRLARWARDDFGPWLESAMLPCAVEETSCGE